MQIGRDGTMVFRSATLLVSGAAFVNDEKLCQQSESLVALQRANCGPVYRRTAASNEPSFVYVNATNVFYFSPVD
jgi:adenylate cyclase